MSQKYVLNEDGTYSETTKRNVTLACGRGYNYYDINSENAKRVCKYARCENATMRKIEDFWTKYPNAFDEFITVDRIVDVGYKNMYKLYNEITFDLKGRANLVAHINDQGLCYEITLHHRSSQYSLRYSKKYDKVWYASSNTFCDLKGLDISEDTKDAIAKKLKALYE